MVSVVVSIFVRVVHAGDSAVVEEKLSESITSVESSSSSVVAVVVTTISEGDGTTDVD